MLDFKNCAIWILLFCLAHPALVRAAQSKDKPLDLEAEAKQAAEEDAFQKAEREKGIKGKYQRQFFGTYVSINNDPNAKISPEVVGMFVTSQADAKPGRQYLVKVENNNKEVTDKLKTLNNKKAQVTGKLRNIQENGDAKYLIVSNILELAPTPPPVERRKFGNL